MALLDSEVARIKAELGYSLLPIQTPYMGTTAIFEQVIQVWLDGGASTTSSTTVEAASAPTPVTLTLASGTGFESGARVVVDVDERQETVTAQNFSGVSLAVQLQKAHSGTYPVTVEGGESIVREILRNIATVKRGIAESMGEGAVKRVDELEFYNSGSSTAGSLESQLTYWRNELAAALGVPNMWARAASGAQRLAVY